MPIANLTRRGIAGLPSVTERTMFFDATLKGFGLRVSPPSEREPAGTRVWFIKYRPRGGNEPKRYVIASTAEMKPEEARQRAKDLLADVRKGGDPMNDLAAVRRAETLEQLVRTYIDEEIKPKRKASTLALYEGYLKNHIAPRSNDAEARLAPGAVGGQKAIGITRQLIAKAHREIGVAQPMTANRVVTLISATYTWAAKHGAVPESCTNPARGIGRYEEQSRERFLTTPEFERLGETLRLAETTGLLWDPDPKKKAKHAPKEKNRHVVLDQFAVAAIRLLIFTGCRLREILHLRWSEVDLERGLLFLPTSKTGKKTIVLSAPAQEILASLPRVGLFVVAGESAGKEDERPRADLQRPWARVIAHAKLDKLRIHDLRHSFASVGVGGGMGLPIVGKLLGHADVKTTARYAHLEADPVRRAANSIAGTIQAAMSGKAGAVVTQFSGRGQ